MSSQIYSTGHPSRQGTLSGIHFTLLYTKKKHIRETLDTDHTLFLTYLDIPGKSSQSMRPTTVSNWLTSAMKDAGIDTDIFSAHSFRAATSTKAVQEGHDIQEVNKHANWSLNSNTFERFYYKPVAQASSSSAINNSFFSLPENRITLDVGMESTRIDLGTTNNTNVDVMETENVIHTRPWYRYFF